MNISKVATTAGVGTAVVVGSLLAVTAASAQSGNTAERAAEFAERFNLDEAEVQAYFEEKKAERQEEREAARAEHLQSLVDAGTITEAQRADLEGFQEQRQALKESLSDQDLTKEEKKAEFEELKTEVEAWADEQGVSLEDIRPQGRHGKKGFGHRHIDINTDES